MATDVSAGYLDLCKSGIGDYNVLKADVHICTLGQRLKHVRFSAEEVGDLRMLGVGVDAISINAFAVANIMGTHFRAGQWGKHSRTCSSVFTCVLNGRSVYGYVCKFLNVDGDNRPGFASVKWFGPPQYPCGSNRLEVVVSAGGEDIEREIGSCLIPITKIDPSMVVVEPVNGVTYRMMRQSGYDTVRS